MSPMVVADGVRRPYRLCATVSDCGLPCRRVLRLDRDSPDGRRFWARRCSPKNDPSAGRRDGGSVTGGVKDGESFRGSAQARPAGSTNLRRMALPLYLSVTKLAARGKLGSGREPVFPWGERARSRARRPVCGPGPSGRGRANPRTPPASFRWLAGPRLPLIWPTEHSRKTDSSVWSCTCS
jgi:hypothetical protein